MPVVVEIEVAGIVARAAKAGVDVETAMRPRRDTGGTLLQIVDFRVSG